MANMKSSTQGVSVPALFFRFKWRISLTLSLVLIEAALTLFFPLAIGLAVNDLVDDSYAGIIILAGLTSGLLVIGTARRFYDTRAYSGIYRIVASEMVDREQSKGTDVSTISARSSLLTELVEFLENSLPEIVTSLIGVVGILVILAGINIWVFLASLGLLLIVIVTYWITGGRNLRLNAGYNNELERRVDALSAGNRRGIFLHFARLMRWNVRLSDLETSNYFVFFAGVVALVIFAPFALINDDVEVGFVTAALLYVFQYIEGLVTAPYYLQQGIRLKEISGRLSSD